MPAFFEDGRECVERFLRVFDELEFFFNQFYFAARPSH
jgi:hypothetical protein